MFTEFFLVSRECKVIPKAVGKRYFCIVKFDNNREVFKVMEIAVFKGLYESEIGKNRFIFGFSFDMCKIAVQKTSADFVYMQNFTNFGIFRLQKLSAVDEYFDISAADGL